MNFLKVSKVYFDFLRLKWTFDKLEKYNNLFKQKSTEKRKFVKFFIIDEEDKALNKKVLDNFDKAIQKYKYKIYKKDQKLNKLLFKLGIVDLNYIQFLYNQNVSDEKVKLVKNIIKYKIISNEKEHSRKN